MVGACPRVAFVALTLAALSLVAPGVLAADPSGAPVRSAEAGSSVATAPPASVALETTLLTAADLPAGVASQGTGDASGFDTDSLDFAASGGLDSVDQIWQDPAQGPVTSVFDFRFLLPTSDAAHTYLTKAEPTLSEAAASGLKPVSDSPTIGDESRYYAGTATAGGVTVALHNVLFRVGPVVAKVFVGGFGTTAADALPIAQAAAMRVAAVLSGTPIPTLAPIPTTVTPAGTPGTTPPSSPTALLEQWAIEAVASSQYSDSDWSATQATGAPDTQAYGDHGTAWAPANQAGTTEWLQLDYARAVVPTSVEVIESDGPGSVTRIEAWDAASATWATLWQGTDPTPAGAIGDFSPPFAATDLATSRIRVTIDTDVPDWNEVDAVKLIGTPAGPAGPSQSLLPSATVPANGAASPATATSAFGADRVVLSDTFDDRTGWGVAQDTSSSIAYGAGKLVLTIQPSGVSRWAWRTLDRDAPLERVAGTLTISEGTGAAGLMCGGSPRSSDFLFGLVSLSGRWFVGDIVGSKVSVLASGTLPGGPIQPDTPIELAVECANTGAGSDRVGLWVDGTFVGDSSAAPRVGPYGKAGVYAESTDVRTVASLDDVTVSQGDTNTGAGVSVDPGIALLGHVPAGFASGCRAIPAAGSSVAEVRCAPAGTVDALDYTQVATAAELDQLFGGAVGLLGVDQPGKDCQKGPSVQPWSRSGVVAGQLACFPDPAADTGITFLWTDAALLVLAKADAAGLDYPTLFTWWTSAGPNP